MERIDPPTSGASGRIIPLMANMRRSVPSRAAIVRLFIFLQSILLWFFLLLRRTSRLANSSTPSPKAGARKRLKAAEEEDSRQRRELAEAVNMVGPDPCSRSGTFDFLGPRKSSLFCRYWVPVSGEMRLV
jgi:hypothetical protein